MNVFTEISTRELENTLKGKAVRYIVNDVGEGLCLFLSLIHISEPTRH